MLKIRFLSNILEDKEIRVSRVVFSSSNVHSLVSDKEMDGFVAFKLVMRLVFLVASEMFD